ncbi:hypothetical protein D3C85_90180 [compost metagenome]
MLKQYMETESSDIGKVFSMESIDMMINRADSRLDQSDALLASMEEAEGIIDDLETLIDNGDANQTTALMIRERISVIEESTGLTAPIPSMEDHGDDMVAYHQISMEAVSGLWNRIKMAVVSHYQTLFEGYYTLLLGYRRWGNAQLKRIHTLRAEWNGKKGELASTKQKTAMSGQTLGMVFMIDSRLSKDPVGDLTNDVKIAEYICATYPKDLAVYMEKVRGVLAGAKYDSDEVFTKTFLEKMTALPHPFTIFKNDIVGKGNKMLHNRGLEVWKARAVRPVSNEPIYQKLANLSQTTHVREFVFTWSNFNQSIKEDIILENSDVDKLYDFAEQYARLMINAIDTFKPLTRSFKNLASVTKSDTDLSRLSNTNRKAFRQAMSFVRGLSRYSKTPFRLEVTRIQGISMGARLLASRATATAK